MSIQNVLREDAAELDRQEESLTGRIEEAEAKIVDLRRQRDTLRFHRAELIAAAQVLDGVGFRVEREPVLTVHLDKHIAALDDMPKVEPA